MTVTRQLDNPNATGGQVAVAAYQVTGTNLTVTDNIGFGMYSYRRPKLTDSTLTGNDGFEGSYDFFSNRRPKFENVVCGRSLKAIGGTWGVCTND